MLYVLKDTCIDWFLGYICLSEHNDFGSLEAYSIETGILKGFSCNTKMPHSKLELGIMLVSNICFAIIIFNDAVDFNSAFHFLCH